MEIFKIDDNLYQSPAIDNIDTLRHKGIKVVIDLEGGLDLRELGGLLVFYTFWPILDGDLPNLKLLNKVCDLGCALKKDYKILAHCSSGINRASLVNGLILHKDKGMKGDALINYIREKRHGALTNQNFVKYLLSLQ